MSPARPVRPQDEPCARSIRREPCSQWPGINGRLSRVSADITTDEHTGADYYLTRIDAKINYLIGDVDHITGSAKGGNDTLTAAAATTAHTANWFYGDAYIDINQSGIGGNIKVTSIFEIDESFDNLNIDYDGTNTVITTSASTTDSVTLVNYDNSTNQLTADDFLFA